MLRQWPQAVGTLLQTTCAETILGAADTSVRATGFSASAYGPFSLH